MHRGAGPAAVARRSIFGSDEDESPPNVSCAAIFAQRGEKVAEMAGANANKLEELVRTHL